MNEQNVSVVIVGAGISGLVAAWQLRQRGVNVLVLEAEARAGGSVRSERHGPFTVDFGPNTGLDTKPCIREIVHGLGLDDDFQTASEEARNRYILRDARLNALPTSPGRFLGTRHFSWKAKLRLAFEPFIPADRKSEDVTLSHFVKRRLGKEFLDYAIDPFVAGVFAGNPDELSVRNAFPKLWALEQRYGSIIKGAVLGARERKRRNEVSKASARMFSFRGGMQTLTDRLAERLGDSLRLSHAAHRLEALEKGFRVSGQNAQGLPFSVVAPRVILALPAYHAAPLVRPLAADAAEALESIFYPPVTVVFHGFENREPISTRLDGFGYLIPRLEGRRTLGTLWSSTIFPDRAPAQGAALTTFVGGSRQPQEALGDAETLQRKSWQEVQDILKVSGAPSVSLSRTWERAIPQYHVGHHRLMARLEKAEAALPGLHFLANYRGGISLSDCMGSATALAESLGGRP